MKHCLLICTLLLISLSICSCNINDQSQVSQEASPISTHSPFRWDTIVNDAIINDCVSLEDSLTTAYSLADLDTFFKPYHKLNNPTQLLTFYQVNESFPVEIIRITNNYSVYKVQEGGFFYVFWGFYSEEQSVTEQNQTATWSPYVASYVYIPKATVLRNIASIQPEESTASDLLDIDPFLEFVSSSQLCSFSYLNPDELLRVTYTRIRPMPYLIPEELIVTDISVVPRSGQTSNLQQIQNYDLPR